MRTLGRLLLTAAWLAACGGGAATEETSAGGASSGDEAPRAAAEAPPEGDDGTAPAAGTRWLGRLDEQEILTYEVSLPDVEGPYEVRMQVQQRVVRGQSIAIRLVPIGTPLGGEPVFPQWLVATPAALSGLEESAALTTPGFVPLDDAGALRTEAASAQLWRVEERWTAVGAGSGGTEAAVGWTFVERVEGVSVPLSDGDCVRLSREDPASTSTLVVCRDVGVVERREVAGEGRVVDWRLVAIGERVAELE